MADALVLGTSSNGVRVDPLLRIKNGPKLRLGVIFLSCGEEGSNSTAARRRQAISPVGCCLVRGSHESGMSTGTSAADDPKLRLGVVFYLAEKRGRTARPPDGSYHDMDK